MNEKEILEEIKKFAYQLEDYKDKMQLVNAIQGLLDLYQQEREKNKLLLKEKQNK
jgi:hypothetical protein